MSEEKTSGINIIDLQNAVKIIDAAAERGAFKGNELSSVGVVRDRIAVFVQANLPAEEPGENGSPEEIAEQPEAPAKKTRKSNRK